MQLHDRGYRRSPRLKQRHNRSCLNSSKPATKSSTSRVTSSGESFHVLVASWNIGDMTRIPCQVELRRWLCPFNQSNAALSKSGIQDPDVVAVGVQEFGASFFATSQARCQRWVEAVKEALEARSVKGECPSPDSKSTLHDRLREYNVVTLRQWSGFFLLVFARDGICAEDVAWNEVGTGYFYAGHKGAIATSFRIRRRDHPVKDGVRLCFLNAHLAAHAGPKYLAQRRQDYLAIQRRMLFPPFPPQKDLQPKDLRIQAAWMLPWFTTQSSRSWFTWYEWCLKPWTWLEWLGDKPWWCRIDDHDVVFWFGDLNYRITGPDLTAQRIHETITTPTNTPTTPTSRGAAEALTNPKSSLSAPPLTPPCRLLLSTADQLTLERHAGHVFQGYDEAEVTFLPTYKFYLGGTATIQTPLEATSTEYDTRKGRAPSWTDRILYTSRSGWQVKPERYDSHMSINSSDHKPISGAYAIQRCLSTTTHGCEAPTRDPLWCFKWLIGYIMSHTFQNTMHALFAPVFYRRQHHDYQAYRLTQTAPSFWPLFLWVFVTIWILLHLYRLAWRLTLE